MEHTLRKTLELAIGMGLVWVAMHLSACGWY